MLFEVQERLALLNCLPREGDAVTLRILRDFQGDLSLTEEEKAAINLVSNTGQVAWDATKAEPKEIEVGDTMMEVIVKVLTGLDKAKKLTMLQLTLYEKFVPPATEGKRASD